MTVIAFDGKTLAADKRASSGLVFPVTKIFRIGDSLIGIAGNLAMAQELIAWMERGAEPDELPVFQRDSDDYVDMMVIRGDGIYKYERSAYPFKVESTFHAIGSGRDLAMAAMYLGKSAVEAVEVACALHSGCGNGIDSMTL